MFLSVGRQVVSLFLMRNRTFFFSPYRAQKCFCLLGSKWCLHFSFPDRKQKVFLSTGDKWCFHFSGDKRYPFSHMAQRCFFLVYQNTNDDSVCLETNVVYISSRDRKCSCYIRRERNNVFCLSRDKKKQRLFL